MGKEVGNQEWLLASFLISIGDIPPWMRFFTFTTWSWLLIWQASLMNRPPLSTSLALPAILFHRWFGFRSWWINCSFYTSMPCPMPPCFSFSIKTYLWSISSLLDDPRKKSFSPLSSYGMQYSAKALDCSVFCLLVCWSAFSTNPEGQGFYYAHLCAAPCTVPDT